MENSNFTEYKFENYDVRGLKLEINFSKSDSIKIKAHEEINIPIENDIDESFEPLLFGIDMNLEIINNINDLKGKKMILLDGCLLYTSPSPRDRQKSRMPSSA